MDDNADIEAIYRMKLGALWRAVRGEHMAFWCACGYLICEYVRPQSIYTWLDVLPWAQLMILGGVGLSFTDPKRANTPNVETWLLGTYFLILLVSIGAAFYPGVGLARLSEFIAWILVYALITRIINTRKRLILFFLLYLLVNFKMSQHGFLVWAARGFSFDSWGVTGAPGWFQNSGEFGIQLTIYLPMAVGFIEALRVYWSKPVLAFFLAMPVTALGSVVATSSRGAQLAIAVTGVWFTVLSKYRFRAMLAAAVLGALIWSVIPEEQIARLTSSGEDNTSKQRLIYWKRGIEMMMENPLTGIGYSNWLPVYTERWPNDLLHELPHNIFVQAGAELGLPGLIVFVLMIVFVFVNNVRTRKLARANNDRVLGVLSVGMDGALVGFLVSGSFVSVLYYPYFWVHMALCVAMNGIATREFAAATVPGRAGQRVAPPTSSAALPQSAKPPRGSSRAARAARAANRPRI